MLPRSLLLHFSILIIGLESFSSGQQQTQRQNQQRGDYFPNLDHDIEHTFKDVENLIAASSRNGGRRSGGKKNKNSDDDYHVVYEQKPESYSNSYHHSDNYREPTKTTSYGNGGGGNGGGGRRNTYNDNHNPYRRSDSNRRSNKRNEDYDDYDDNPREGRGRAEPVVEYDYDDNTEDKRRSRGYDHNEKYDRSKKDDYHKTGELKDDFDDFGLDSSNTYKRLGGGGGGGRSGGRSGKKSYSNSNRDREEDVEDSDYVDDASASDEGYAAVREGGGKRSGRDSEDNPIDKYEKRTRQALKEYGTLDGNAFLGASRY